LECSNEIFGIRIAKFADNCGSTGRKHFATTFKITPLKTFISDNPFILPPLSLADKKQWLTVKEYATLRRLTISLQDESCQSPVTAVPKGSA
jgi:hypothetical protein